MTSFDTFAATLSLLSAALTATMFLSILRRARRDAEVTVLLLFCGCLTLQQLCYAFGNARVALWADWANVLLLAFMAHFLGLTYWRASGDRTEEEPVFLGLTERRLYYTSYTGFFYTTAALLLAAHLFGWKHHFGSGFLGGFVGGFWPALQFVAIAEVERRLPEDQMAKVPAVMRWMLSTRVAPIHWKELSIRPDSRPARPKDATSEDFTAEVKGLTAMVVWWLAGVAAVMFLEPSHPSTLVTQLWALAKRFGLPLGMVPLIYYKTQFLFFDVLIKRGIVICALFASAALILALPFPDRRTGLTAAAAALAFATGWTAYYGPLNRALDRYIFHRPDYQAVLRTIQRELPRHADRADLAGYIAAKLQSALSAVVRLVDEPAPRTDAVPVAAFGRTWGWLELGPRARRQPYRSEDLGFASAVADALAAAFESLARREERQEQERREQQLRELAARSELKALRAQINPHFLFNALNTLADLTSADPKLAEHIVIALAGMFRFALDATTREEIRLGDEIAFIRSYLEIEQVRFGDRLRFSVEAPEALLDLAVPPMLIQPLVENSVKHGIGPRAHGGSVRVSASLDDRSLRISVQDDGVGMRADARQGIGLSNVRERIERMSGPGRFHVESRPGFGTAIAFELPVNAYAHPDR